MENEDYYEELSDQEVEVGQQELVVGVVAPQPINIPLEVQVVPADNPESPSPSPPSSPEPSPAALRAASPPASPGPGFPQPQFGDAPTFMGFFSADDITELEQKGGGCPKSPGYSRLTTGGTGDFGQLQDIPKIRMGAPVGAEVYSASRGGPHL